ncbi:MAG: hypothetical protein GVY18_04975, partial [Bacteroidetes bacterium]|nr:hypothetical protein [Bacteroidota bacterium]
MMRFMLPTVLLALLLLPLGAQAQPTVDGDLSDADYQTLATKQNANSGFGANIDVQEIVYYADLANDVLYLGVEGTLDTGSNNAIGLWLGFSEVAGVPAGTGLGFGGGGHYLGGNGGSNAGFAADFEVAYGFALNPGNGATNVFVDGASYVGGTPNGGFVGTIDQSGTATSNSGFFTGGAVTHAFDNGGGADQGYEVAIPFSELGITATGELSAFAFVVSSTAFFADVTVPGDVTGGNPGFDADFNTLPGGPYHGTAPVAVPTIDGDITDELWDLLDTNDGGPASSFGDQYITSLSAHDDADFLYLGVGGKLLTGNRILVFVDSEAGGFNLADFGRTDAPPGINNFNSGTTFDPGFAPDYVLVLGGPFGGDFFADFYTLSDAGGPNNFLAGTDGSVGTPGSAIGVQTPPNSSNQDLGFEVQIPKSILGFEPTTNGVQLFAALIGDSGFLSNQFITPAGSGDGNFGGGAVDFGQATPDPVTYLAPTPPAVPTLLAPADNATGLDFDNVFFDWSDAANAASYDFQLSTDPAFGTLITDINLTPSEYTEPSLQSGTTYYWRVRSRNGQVTSAFASASFSTRQALPAPTLQTPADGAMDVATEPTLTWSSVTGATRYAVQVATAPGFAAGDLVVDRDDVTATSLPVGPLDNNVTYYWRARAGDADGFGDWATAFSFTTAPVSVGGIAFDGDFDEGLWELLDTNDGGPTPGFGPLHRINALYAAEDADNLFIGVAGSVTSGNPSNRILVFIDSRSGGFNVANFGRTDAPGGIAAFNSGTTFDDGFLPDYALVIGGPFGGNYFVDLYTLSSSGGPNTFLGGAPAPGLGGDGTVGANPTAEEDNVDQGFEVQIPRTVIDVEDGPGGNGIRLFAAYISDTGFLSNQFITPAGSNEGNYGGDAVSFGTRPPDPVTFRAPLPTSPPGPVELVAPTGGEERSILSLGGLRWTAATQAASYEVEVYPAGSFPDGDPIYTPTPTGTSIPMIRSGPGNYVWRVRGVNQLGAGPWSDPGAFRIVVTVPEIPTFAAPSLIAPPDGATGLTPTVQLEWEDVGAPGYRVEVATTEDFAEGTLVATAVIEQTTYLVTGLTPGQTYFWRVFSTGSGGTSAASATRSFTVGEGGPAPLTFDGQM